MWQEFGFGGEKAKRRWEVLGEAVPLGLGGFGSRDVMATMRVGVVVPACAEGGMGKGMGVRRERIGWSSVWGTTTGLGAVKLEDRIVETTRAARADMSPSEGLPSMPSSHRIKAASVSAFQEFQNARANREYPIPIP